MDVVCCHKNMMRIFQCYISVDLLDNYYSVCKVTGSIKTSVVNSAIVI